MTFKKGSWHLIFLYLKGAFGIPKPWNFPFTKAYWLGTSDEPISPPIKRHPFKAFISRSTWWNNSQRTPCLSKPPPVPNEQSNLEPEKDWKSMYEDEPTHLPLGVSITKLSKKYKNASKYAVHNLNLTLYEGQITALLGPTGSGKTTIM